MHDLSPKESQHQHRHEPEPFAHHADPTRAGTGAKSLALELPQAERSAKAHGEGSFTAAPVFLHVPVVIDYQ